MAKKKEVKEEIKEESKEEVLDKKALKAQKKKAQKKKVEGLWAEFKKFITRGNVVDMSIGVVIGGAFGAIVTALTNIFLSVCTWTIPGGINGLITVLPAFSDTQAGIEIGGKYIQQFATVNLNDYVAQLAQEKGISLSEALSTITSKYTLHGSTYVFNGAAIIDWGTFINAVISFIVIAIVLFIIIKIFAKLQKTRAEMHAKAMEEYYKKHPEERPAPVVPGLPEPTDHQLLKDILNELRVQNGAKKAKKK